MVYYYNGVEKTFFMAFQDMGIWRHSWRTVTHILVNDTLRVCILALIG